MSENTEAAPETPVERLKRLIAVRQAYLLQTWRWGGQKGYRIALRETIEEELHDLVGAGMATAEPRLVAVITVLLDEVKQ